ncbi:MAG TPA: hypothetical protein IGS40_07780 [Trichormus sp. M33_DOE_039]|nr:hypothetical protein [Trichormus sp. M33_DOE_039]
MPINNAINIQMPSSFTTASNSTELTNSLSTTASNPIAANSNRKGLTIWNTLSVDVFVDATDTVSSSNYQFKLGANSYYEMPVPIYTGALWIATASGSGSIEIRELS